MSRMLWGQLFPRPALIFADFFGLQRLLGHACYQFVLLTESRIANGLPIDEQNLLCPRQLTYIRAGYHSLKAYWHQISRTPVFLDRSPECRCHTRCVKLWGQQWVIRAGAKTAVSELDVLNRLTHLEKNLSRDELLMTGMDTGCLALGLRAIALKREHTAQELHHLFDLP